MQNWSNKPKGLWSMISRYHTIVRKLRQSTAALINPILQEKWKQVSWKNFLSDTETISDEETINDYIQDSSDSLRWIDSYDDLLWVEWFNQWDYEDTFPIFWKNIVISILHKSVVNNDPLKWRRLAQKFKNVIENNVPSNLQGIIKKWYWKWFQIENFDVTLIDNEIQYANDIFIDTINLIFRLNTLLDDDDLSRIVSNFTTQDRKNDEQWMDDNGISLHRVAFLIRIKESWILSWFIEPSYIDEIIKSQLLILWMEWEMTIWADILLKELEEGTLNKESYANKDPVDEHERSDKVLSMFSSFMDWLNSIKSKTKSFWIEKNIVKNLLWTSINDSLARKIFNNDNPVYKLIFKSIVCLEESETKWIKFDIEFKKFLLRLMVNLPKTLDNIWKSLPPLYIAMINLEAEKRLNQNKQESILDFLNLVGRVHENIDFCIFVILGDLENIDMIQHLNESDKVFILQNFSGDERETAFEWLKIMSYEDLVQLKSLSKSELKLAIWSINQTLELFSLQNLRKEIEEDLQWIPTDAPWYIDLQSLLEEDTSSQNLEELTTRKDAIYTQSEINESAQTHRLMMWTLISSEDRSLLLEDIWFLYKCFWSMEVKLKRLFVYEIFELDDVNRNTIISLIRNNEWFNYSLLVWKSKELSIFVASNLMENDNLQDIWDLFTEQLEQNCIVINKKEASEFNIFTEAFWEQLGLKILLLGFPSELNKQILSIWNRLNSSQIPSFVDFICKNNAKIQESIRWDFSKIISRFQFLFNVINFFYSKEITIFKDSGKLFSFCIFWEMSINDFKRIEARLDTYEIEQWKYDVFVSHILRALKYDDQSYIRELTNKNKKEEYIVLWQKLWLEIENITASKIDDKIDLLLKEILSIFKPSNTSSTMWKWWLGSWNYTRIFASMLGKLKKESNESSEDYVNRMLHINWNNIYNWADITDKKLSWILSNSADSNWDFYDTIKNFHLEVIKRTVTSSKVDISYLTTFWEDKIISLLP